MGKPAFAICAVLAAAACSLVSCASVPARRVDTVLSGAVARDLGSRLAEASIAGGPTATGVERVVRELFPAAAAQVGLVPAAAEGRAEYAVWLRENEYTVGIDTYSAVLCVLKLRSKADGSALATTVVADETRLSIKSSGYLYALLRDALRSLVGSVSDSARASKAAEAAAR